MHFSKEEVCSRFVKYDKDESGNVTTEEAMEVLTEKFPSADKDTMRAMIGTFDTDGTGKLSYKEFIYFYANVSIK